MSFNPLKAQIELACAGAPVLLPEPEKATPGVPGGPATSPAKAAPALRPATTAAQIAAANVFRIMCLPVWTPPWRRPQKSSLIWKTFAAAICAAVVAGLSAGAAFAGEVAGPPGTPGVAFSGSGKSTGAPAHASSICAFNGLNDMNPDQGQIDFFVQTPHNQGSPGDAGHGTCAGGTNPRI